MLQPQQPKPRCAKLCKEANLFFFVNKYPPAAGPGHGKLPHKTKQGQLCVSIVLTAQFYTDFLTCMDSEMSRVKQIFFGILHTCFMHIHQIETPSK